jgi:hypothetical protein
MAGALAFLGRCNDADRWDAVHKLHRPDADWSISNQDSSAGSEGARAGAYAFPRRSPSGPSSRSSSSVTARPNPIGLLLAGGDGYAAVPEPPSASHREGHGLSAISK